MKQDDAVFVIYSLHACFSVSTSVRNHLGSAQIEHLDQSSPTISTNSY